MQIQISWLLQKPIDLDLHCLQRQDISGFSRTRVKSLSVYLKCIMKYPYQPSVSSYSIITKNVMIYLCIDGITPALWNQPMTKTNFHYPQATLILYFSLYLISGCVFWKTLMDRKLTNCLFSLGHDWNRLSLPSFGELSVCLTNDMCSFIYCYKSWEYL